MITDLKLYPAMKDFGVEWLGEVPEHWEVRRGKNLFHSIDVRSETGEEELLTVSSERGVVPRRSANVTMFKAESYVGHKLCWPGDLVINSLWAWAQGLGVSSYHGIVSTAYGVYRPKEIVNAKFIHELVRSTPFHWELRVRSKGIWTSRLQLTDDSFLCAPFLLPPLPEQNAIVRFLDYVERRVRRLIRAKQKMIELLEELKQAIIHRTVTRGLDPDVPLKPSDVEWLGDVPKHWEVRRLKNSARLIMGQSPSSENCSSDPIGLPFLQGCAEFGLIYPKPVQFCRTPAKMSPSGAILISVRAPVGRLNVADQEYGIGRGLCAIVPNKTQFDVSFARYSLEALGHGLAIVSTGSTYDAVSVGNIGSQPSLLPHLHEQKAIVEYLDKATTNINTTVDRRRREIELLREFRTRLISDVVTGKLDVREAATNLPDELDEEDIPDEDDELIGNGDDIAKELDEIVEEVEE